MVPPKVQSSVPKKRALISLDLIPARNKKEVDVQPKLKRNRLVKLEPVGRTKSAIEKRRLYYFEKQKLSKGVATCGVCEASQASSQGRQKHLADHVAFDYSLYRCRECGKKFTREQKYLDHKPCFPGEKALIKFHSVLLSKIS